MAPERWKVGGGGVPNVHRPHYYWVSFVHVHSMVMTILVTFTCSLYMDIHFSVPVQAYGWVSTLLVQQLRYEELLDNFQ